MDILVMLSPPTHLCPSNMLARNVARYSRLFHIPTAMKAKHSLLIQLRRNRNVCAVAMRDVTNVFEHRRDESIQYRTQMCWRVWKPNFRHWGLLLAIDIVFAVDPLRVMKWRGSQDLNFCYCIRRFCINDCHDERASDGFQGLFCEGCISWYGDSMMVCLVGMKNRICIST